MKCAAWVVIAMLGFAAPAEVVAAEGEEGSVALIRDVLFGQEPICFVVADVASLPQLTVDGVPVPVVSNEAGRVCYQGLSGNTGPARAAVSWGTQTVEVDLRLLRYQTAWQPDLLTVQLAGLDKLPGPQRFELMAGNQHGGGQPQVVVVEPGQVQPVGTALIQVVALGAPSATPVLQSNAVLAPEYSCGERDIEISGKFNTPAPVITKTASSSKVTRTFQLPLKWFCFGGFAEQSYKAFLGVAIAKSAWKGAATG
jgi:hypothetical protein